MSEPTDFDFSGAFDADYLHFYETMLTAERSDGEAGVVWNLLGLKPGAAVLDLACGHGRIANRLAESGARVTGLDRTALFLARAREDAAARGAAVEYVEGDMRAIPWRERFDAVLLWYTAFGYFDEAGNEAVLRGIAAALKPGGRVLLDQPNRAQVIGWEFPAHDVVQRGDDLMVDIVNYDVLTDRSRVERIIVRDGKVRRTRFAVRLYSFSELEKLALAAGFRAARAFDQVGGPLTLTSGRMIFVARK